MSPDRTASTTLRPTFAQRSAAPDTATPDGFAALLGAVEPAAPGRAERRDAGERSGHGRGPGDRAESGRGPGDRAHAGRGPGDRPESGRGPSDGHDGAIAADPLAVPVATAPAAPTPVIPAGEPVLADPLPAVVTPVAAPDMPAAAVPAPVVDAAPALPAAPPVLDATPVATPVAPVAAAPTAPVAPQPAADAAAIAPVAVAEPAAPAAELPHDALPAAGAPQADTPDAAPAPAEPAVAPTPETPVPGAATPAGSGTGTGTGGQQSAPREQPAQTPAEAPVAAPTAPSAPPAQSATAPAPLAGPAANLQRTTPLHQAPRAVAQVIQVAQDRGISHAKLNLRPVELGGIEIRLQSSSAGVTAQVVADSPEAAKLLHQAADDLRRSLERQDVTLLSLDVSTAGDGRPDGSAGTSADLAGDRARHFAAFGGAPENADADAAPVVVETVEIADGLHIDVLA